MGFFDTLSFFRKPIETKKVEQLSILEMSEFLGISEEQFLRLKNRIESNFGVVKIYMHPNYSINTSDEKYHTNDYKIFDTLVESAYKSSNDVLFVFESGLGEETDLYSQEKFNGSIFKVMTYRNAGVPYFKKSAIPLNLLDRGISVGISESEISSSYDMLAQVFEFLGIKKIECSGMYIGVEKNKIKTGCLGTFAIEMHKRGFNVSFIKGCLSVGCNSIRTLSILDRAVL
jgi:hypothetical protein